MTCDWAEGRDGGEVPAAEHWRGMAERRRQGSWPRGSYSATQVGPELLVSQQVLCVTRAMLAPGLEEQVGKVTEGSPAGRNREAISLLSDRC